MDAALGSNTVGSNTVGWDAAWAEALTAMELDVAEAERLLTAAHAGGQLPDANDVMLARWVPRHDLGALPTPLRDRAAALLERQREAAHQLLEATYANRRHARAAAALREDAPTVPVYVDTAL